MSDFAPRDSKILRNLGEYTHPRYVTPKEEGQGRYVMMDINRRLVHCQSGNNLLFIHNQDPSRWLTGPIWMPLSQEDCDRINAQEQSAINKF